MSKVVEAAEEFVEKMTDAPDDLEGSGSPEVEEGGSGQRPTMDERKAKIEELRRKMVRCMLTKTSLLILTKSIGHSGHRH